MELVFRYTGNYSPFGVQLRGRNLIVSGVSKQFRYGYQNFEQDDEIKGDGNSYTTEFRQLDPRLGRWLTMDPVVQPWQSPYCSMDNKPILFTDPFGDKIGTGKAKDKYESIKNEGESYKDFKKRFNDFKRSVNKEIRSLNRNSETFNHMYDDLEKSETNYNIQRTDEGSHYDEVNKILYINLENEGEVDVRLKIAHELAHNWRDDKKLDNNVNPYTAGTIEHDVWFLKAVQYGEREAYHIELIIASELKLVTRERYGFLANNNTSNVFYSRLANSYILDISKQIDVEVGKVKDYDYDCHESGYHYKNLLLRSQPVLFNLKTYTDKDAYSGH